MKTKKEELSPLVASQQTAIPSGQHSSPIYKTSQDARIKECKKVYNQSKRHRCVQVFKVPRAGMTTSMIIALLQAGKKVLILEPTNEIILTTLDNNMKRFYIDTTKVPSNKYCPINQERIKENPLLGNLPYLYLPTKCSECHFFKECPVTEILRVDNPKVIASTYSKLDSLMMSESTFNNTMSAQILAKMLAVDYIILDEAHVLARPKDVRLEFANNFGHDYIHKLRNILIKLGKENNIDLMELERLLLNYLRIINSDIVLDTQQSLSFLIDRKDNTKVHSKTFPNPHPNVALCVNLVQNEDGTYSEPTDLNDAGASKAIYEKIILLSENIKGTGISEIDITNLCSMLSLIQADHLTIHSQRKVETDSKGNFLYAYKVHDICAIDTLQQERLANFLYRFNKKIILTSATFGSYDYTKILPYKPHKMMFGDGGDVLNTYSKMYVYADSKTFTNDKRSPYHIKNMLDEIYSKCVNIFELYGDNDCIIFTKNKKDYHLIKKLFDKSPYKPAITYYNSPQTIGVECEKRVGIAIGLAYKPKHAFDYFASTPEESQIINLESLHSDTCQGLNRFKCPSAIDVSLLFVIGARLEDVKASFIYGIDRKIEIIGDDKRVRCVTECKSPKIKYLNSWRDTLIDSLLSKFPVNVIAQKVPQSWKWCGVFSQITLTTNLNSSPLMAISQNNLIKNGNANLQADSCSHLLGLHTTGKVTLQMNILQSDNRVDFILYESEDEETTKKVMIWLNIMNIPFLLEKQKYSMEKDTDRIWIFIELEPAYHVKNFALYVLKQAGIPYYNNDKIRVYPRQTNIGKNDNNDTITLPFGHNSRILVGTEFVPVKNIDIDIVKIPERFEIDKFPT